jgi:hypothetical protein
MFRQERRWETIRQHCPDILNFCFRLLQLAWQRNLEHKTYKPQTFHCDVVLSFGVCQPVDISQFLPRTQCNSRCTTPCATVHTVLQCEGARSEVITAVLPKVRVFGAVTQWRLVSFPKFRRIGLPPPSGPSNRSNWCASYRSRPALITSPLTHVSYAYLTAAGTHLGLPSLTDDYTTILRHVQQRHILEDPNLHVTAVSAPGHTHCIVHCDWLYS